MALVSLLEARSQLGTDPSDDVQVELYTQLASDAVVDYVGLDPVTGLARTWTIATVPGAVKAAILHHIAHLWLHRGDEDPPAYASADLPPSVTRLLTRYRDPVVA